MPGVACKGVSSVEVFKPAVSLAVALASELEIDLAALLLLVFRMECGIGVVRCVPGDALLKDLFLRRPFEDSDLGCDAFVTLLSLLDASWMSITASSSSLIMAFSASSNLTCVTLRSCAAGSA